MITFFIFVKHFELPCVERCYINKLALPVRVVLDRPVWGRRSCQGCRSRGDQDLVAGCPEAYQRSHREGKVHLTLRHREAEIG